MKTDTRTNEELIMISDGFYSEHITAIKGLDIEDLTRDYLSDYSFEESEQNVDISVTVYHDGEEGDIYTCSLTNDHKVTDWKKIA